MQQVTLALTLKEVHSSVQEDLSQYAIDGEQQQAAVLAIADKDGFNWGYDPVHYMAPEGSYATDPDGSARVKEFRQMVQSLHGLGLKVVLDVVYNHTFASGLEASGSALHVCLPVCLPACLPACLSGCFLLKLTCYKFLITDHAAMTMKHVLGACVHLCLYSCRTSCACSYARLKMHSSSVTQNSCASPAGCLRLVLVLFMKTECCMYMDKHQTPADAKHTCHDLCLVLCSFHSTSKSIQPFCIMCKLIAAC